MCFVFVCVFMNYHQKYIKPPKKKYIMIKIQNQSSYICNLDLNDTLNSMNLMSMSSQRSYAETLIFNQGYIRSLDLHYRINTFIKRGGREKGFVTTQQEHGYLQIRQKDLTRTSPCWYLGLRLQRLPTERKQISVL